MKSWSLGLESLRVGRRFRQDLAPHLPRILLVGLASLLLAGLDLLKPWPLQWIFDEALAPQGEPRHAFGTVVAAGAAAAVGIAVLHALVQYVRAVRLADVGHRVTRSLRHRIFSHLACLSPDFHARHKAGDLLVRLMGDVPMLRTMLVDSTVELGTRLVLIVGTLVVLFALDPFLTLVLCGLLPLLFLVARWLSGRLAIAVRKQRRKEGELADFLHEAIAASSVIQSLGRGEHVVRRFARDNRRSARAGLKATRIAARISASVEALLGCALAGALALGSLRVASGQLTPGELLVFLSYVRGLLKPVRSASRHAEKIAKGTACGERVLQVLEADPHVTSAPGAPPAPAQPASLRFEGVDFGYDERGLALDGLDVEFRRGELVALVGPSGAGKSTLAMLAARLRDPARGAVRMDGIPLRDLALDSVRDRIGLCLQETVLFGESVRENLLLGRPEATEEELWAALEAAGLGGTIAALPDGLDAVLGAAGAGLSGGERRRLSLARTLLRAAPIVIVDEPFAGLDGEAVARVAETLRAVAADHVVIVIAHDPDDLDRFDRIVFLERGRVRGEGSRRELERAHPRFTEVMRSLREVPA